MDEAETVVPEAEVAPEEVVVEETPNVEVEEAPAKEVDV